MATHACIQSAVHTHVYTNACPYMRGDGCEGRRRNEPTDPNVPHPDVTHVTLAYVMKCLCVMVYGYVYTSV